MRSTIELAAIVRRAMRSRSLDQQGLAKLLGINTIMVDKLLCGDIVPSHSLEKQMVEVLGIAPTRVRRFSERLEKKSKQTKPASGRSAAKGTKRSRAA